MHIATTPLDIYNAVRQDFPSADCDIVYHESKQPYGMRLQLAPGYPSIELQNGIDVAIAKKALLTFSNRVQFAQLLNKQPPTLDPDKFSLQSPLVNYQHFARIIHERRGHSCRDAVTNYLQNENGLDTLCRLGLAPEQVEINCNEQKLSYFEHISGPLFCNFREKYPKTAGKRLAKLSKEKIAKDIASRENTYQTTYETLEKSVIGQAYALQKSAMQLNAQLTTDEKTPNNRVFLFVGPTGIGKTELAKAISKIKHNKYFFNLPMAQYSLEYAVSNLFGSSTGFVGSDDKPHLAKELDKFNPQLKKQGSDSFYELRDVVLLFDEFEKAHSAVKQSLLPLLDEGYCICNYTSQNKNKQIKYRLVNSIIIATSNLYQDRIVEEFRSQRSPEDISKLFIELNKLSPTTHSYSPELLGRMVVIPFGPIPKGETYQKLLKIKISSFYDKAKTKLKCKEIALATGKEQAILGLLENKLYGNGTSIRVVERYFEDILNLILAHKDGLGNLENQKVTITHREEVIGIEFEYFIEELGHYAPPHSFLPLP